MNRRSPQGAVISPLLANIYLNPLDHLIAGAGYRMVRYADDFVIFCVKAVKTRSGLWNWYGSGSWRTT